MFQYQFQSVKLTSIQELQREIQWQLHQLIGSAKTDVLFKLAASISNELKEDLPGDDATEVELYNFIKWRGGKSRGPRHDLLLVFNDLIAELQQPPVAAEEQCELAADTESLVAPSALKFKADRSPVVTSQVTDVIKLTDVAVLLPRREFKIHSGHISDTDSDVSNSLLCRQTDEWLAENITEAEVIRIVLKIIQPGGFKDILMTKAKTKAELKRFLRAHSRDKSNAELFQKLGNTKQQDREIP